MNASDYYGVSLNQRSVIEKWIIIHQLIAHLQLGKPGFNDNELADIVNHLITLTEIGYGYSPFQLTNFILLSEREIQEQT